MTFQREVHDGMCNQPQPWNWRGACHRVYGHDGPHWTRADYREVFWEDTVAGPRAIDLGEILDRLPPSSLSAVPGTETEPENEKSAASTAVERDVR